MAFEKIGYGQVEPNHLSAQRTGQIYAQLPCAAAIDVLENGTFVKYDAAAGEVNFTGAGEWMLVYNEIKLYEDRQFLADYAMKKTDFSGGVMTPRVFKTNVGDIMTTNRVAEGANVTYEAGDILVVNATGILEKKDAVAGDMRWEVAKVTTMPDGLSVGLKLVRIADAVAVAVDTTPAG